MKHFVKFFDEGFTLFGAVLMTLFNPIVLLGIMNLIEKLFRKKK